MASADYDQVGKHYSVFRHPDRRIARLIHEPLLQAKTLINIGAGTGSYEPEGKTITAVDPSATMLNQRPNNPDVTAIQAYAEHLPFEDNAFDGAMAILTLHHWQDWKKGLMEAKRVTRGKVVLLTWFGMPDGFWLYEYFSELAHIDKGLFPGPEDIASVLGKIDILDVPIPRDCTDGFLCAYWARPERYLDEQVRSAISTFSRISQASISEGVSKLSDALANGSWHKKYQHLLASSEQDYGYRLVVSGDNA